MRWFLTLLAVVLVGLVPSWTLADVPASSQVVEAVPVPLGIADGSHWNADGFAVEAVIDGDQVPAYLVEYDAPFATEFYEAPASIEAAITVESVVNAAELGSDLLAAVTPVLLAVFTVSAAVFLAFAAWRWLKGAAVGRR